MHLMRTAAAGAIAAVMAVLAAAGDVNDDGARDLLPGGADGKLPKPANSPWRPAMHAPMPVPEESSARARWLGKEVLTSRLLDDMESAKQWQHFGPGRMSFTRERRRDGKQSIRLESPTKTGRPNATRGRPFGEAGLRRRFDQEDWRAFNRLSVWVYPTMTGHKRGSVLLKLTEAGPKQKLGPWVRGAMNHALVQPGRWNHIVWEIPHLPRQKVTALDLIYRLQGNEPGAAESVCLDFDRLELQKVEPDHFEGWRVAPGRIAFCHTGYPVGSPKTALASGLKAERFCLVDRRTGKAVVTRPIRTVKTDLGEYQVMDFTDVDRSGEYVLEAGGVPTRPFRIDSNIWRETIRKSVNFFYCERCGAEVPGLHDICHGDLHAVHKGRRIVTNGGWHDAGDLSQGEINTAEGVYSMLCLAERLAGSDEELSSRLIEEAVWGLKWLHKTRFGDGARVMWQTMDFWTDGRAGGVDDVQARVEDSPYGNYIGAKASALAARVLKARRRDLARESLKAAREDWQFAEKKAKGHNVELASEAVLASVELFRATGEGRYADRAAELAKAVVACQQQAYPDWDVPLTGFFYKDAKKRGILNFFHRGHDQAPVVALVELCRALPNHADWMTWYAAVVLHSEYQRRTAAFNRPYHTLCAGIYPLARDPKEVSLGIRLSKTHYLRRFPVVGDWRGHFGVLLSQTKALSAAARLRGRKDLADLCHAQLQWVIGRNPFCQSAMCGEGYDFAPQYTPMCGDLVGSLPVGFQYRGGTDAPFWPASNCWVYKEVWVHSSSRWLWVLSDLAGPVRPSVAEGCDFSVRQETGRDGSVVIRVKASGRGRHTFTVRAWNLALPIARKEVTLKQGEPVEITWAGKVRSADRPWVAVVIPDGRLAGRKDVTGSAPH